MAKKGFQLIKVFIYFVLILSISSLGFTGSYPEKPIKTIVPFGAGGLTDTHARFLQKALGKTLPQPLVVVDIPGGGSIIGTRKAKESPADGYNMLTTINSFLTGEAMGVADFGPEVFIPVAQTGTCYMVVAVAKNSPFKTLHDLINAAKAKPNTIKEAINIGAITHFSSLALCDAAGGVQMRYIQVGGGAKRIASILGGHCDITQMSTSEVKPHYDSGDMRVLCIFAPERNADFPEVPTAKELGYDAELLDVSIWWFMPKGAPEEAVTVMVNAFEKAMKDKELLNNFKNRTTAPTFLKGDALKAKIYEDRRIIQELAKKRNMGKLKKK